MLIHIITLGTSLGFAIATDTAEALEIIRLNTDKARYSTISYNIREVSEDEINFLESLQRDISTLKHTLHNDDNHAVVVTALSNRLLELENTFNTNIINILAEGE